MEVDVPGNDRVHGHADQRTVHGGNGEHAPRAKWLQDVPYPTRKSSDEFLNRVQVSILKDALPKSGDWVIP